MLVFLFQPLLIIVSPASPAPEGQPWADLLPAAPLSRSQSLVHNQWLYHLLLSVISSLPRHHPSSDLGRCLLFLTGRPRQLSRPLLPGLPHPLLQSPPRPQVLLLFLPPPPSLPLNLGLRWVAVTSAWRRPASPLLVGSASVVVACPFCRWQPCPSWSSGTRTTWPTPTSPPSRTRNSPNVWDSPHSRSASGWPTDVPVLATWGPTTAADVVLPSRQGGRAEKRALLFHLPATLPSLLLQSASDHWPRPTPQLPTPPRCLAKSSPSHQQPPAFLRCCLPPCAG